MKILLWENVENLGKRGDTVEVANGYARNYLFPRQIATEANKQNLKNLEFEKKRLIKLEAKAKEEAEALAQKISDLSCTLEVNANEEGALYGAVTSQQIADAMLNQQVEIDARKIIIEEPIKELGVYTVKILMDKEVKAKLKVWVVEKID